MKISHRLQKIIILLMNIILTEGIAILVAFSIKDIAKTYDSLKKSIFSPPNYVFMIVWPILYLLMSISSNRILLKRNEDSRVKKAIILYIVQLGVNFLWTAVFFQFKLYGLAFIVSLFLVILIFFTIIIFYGIHKISAFLLIPYLLWVSYASVLNLTIWLLNEA
ncbi:tryptophan-rich sensory protein [Clostridium sp. 19966]|uniref:TspO/MBR family protein n=1 Tax=Clostridium sp. 19966 TaxID=2768166 RepID=UPI0028DD56C2|nr:TspO/MBR family protein [Clostridium sp. 19966]MDT8716299.1 tryptophan-rich sensory protein [Clostridium sp. 19966]